MARTSVSLSKKVLEPAAAPPSTRGARTAERKATGDCSGESGGEECIETGEWCGAECIETGEWCGAWCGAECIETGAWCGADIVCDVWCVCGVWNNGPRAHAE